MIEQLETTSATTGRKTGATVTGSPQDAAPMVECFKVGKVYPPQVQALREVSLSAAPGELLFITGNSGAGKSTLLKLICREEAADSGLLTVNGHDLSRLSPPELQRLRRHIGVAYQDFRLLPRLSVDANIAMAMEVDYRPRREINHRVEELLAALALDDKRQRPVASLSRGEQQRVAIARAAANRPALLLADEPTGNLDETSGALVLALFKELARQGTTVIAATHDDRLYRAENHRVLHLEQGTVRAAGGLKP